jgi:hypothetical protein
MRLSHLSLILGALLAAPSGFATSSFSFTGTFTYDTDVQFFEFTLQNDTSDVSLRTWSYAGGVNAAGQTISSGGFQPVLSLFMSDGTGMNPGIAGPCTVPPTGNPLSDLLPDPTTGECADVYYPTTGSFPGGVWQAGTYIVALSEDANPSLGNLTDGFFASGVLGLPVPSNFTCQVGSPGFQGNPPTFPVTDPFCDESAPGVERTGAWALDINTVDSATEVTLPEPGTLPLVSLAAIVMVWSGRRFRNRRA